jgi:hypothetical protein
MKESELVDLIKSSKSLQNQLSEICGFSNKIKLVNEDRFINGITVDYTVLIDGKISALIECKGDDIGVTDFVRGIGQIMQYQYFITKNIDPKGRGFNADCKVILIFPSNLLINNKFNIGRFSYPDNCYLIEVNNHSKVPRLIDEKERNKLSRDTLADNLQTISHYYVRDNRVFELYILLKFISIEFFKGKSVIDRKKTEEFLCNNINVINNGNWRNVFITLQSLGLMNNKNLPTKAGIDMIFLGYAEFAYEVYESFFKPYFKEIIYLIHDGKLELSNQEIVNQIREKYNGKDIMYLTESNGRYVSSWLNILRDDYGMLEFETRSNNRKLNYNIVDLKKEKVVEIIHNKSLAEKYIKNFHKII